eukprot:4761823-Prymnesium_polylepis.2
MAGAMRTIETRPLLSPLPNTTIGMPHERGRPGCIMQRCTTRAIQRLAFGKLCKEKTSMVVQVSISCGGGQHESASRFALSAAASLVSRVLEASIAGGLSKKPLQPSNSAK